MEAEICDSEIKILKKLYHTALRQNQQIRKIQKTLVQTLKFKETAKNALTCQKPSNGSGICYCAINYHYSTGNIHFDKYSVSALTFPFGFSFRFLAVLLGFLHAPGGDAEIFE